MVVSTSTMEVKKAQNDHQETDNMGAAKEQLPHEVRIIAKEIQIVKALACNNLVKRNRQLLKLRTWFRLRSRSSFPYSDDDFMRIWKGLYYNMWMSDKPLVQEELAEQLGKLVDCFNGKVEMSIRFFRAFLCTMCQEWFGMDQWRIDKFMMLVRRMLRAIFRVLKSSEWKQENIQMFNEQLHETVLADRPKCIGLTMHILDIFFEELAKVADGKMSAEQVAEFVRPFVTFIATQRDTSLITHCRRRVFNHLLYQSSLGREYSERYNAWKEMGFPATIDDLEKVETESVADGDDEVAQDTEANEKQLDPRAGKVDIFMPELLLDAKYIIDELERFLYKRESSTKCRKMLKKLLGTFQTYQNGKFPLGVRTMPNFLHKVEKPVISEKVEELENLENELYGTGRKLKQLSKRQRRRLFKTIDFENVDESNFEQAIDKAIPKNVIKEKMKKAQLKMMTGWLEEELNENDNDVTLSKAKQKKKKKPVEKQVIGNMMGKRKQNKNVESNEDQPAKKVKKLEVSGEWQVTEADSSPEKVKPKKTPSKLVPNPLFQMNGSAKRNKNVNTVQSQEKNEKEAAKSEDGEMLTSLKKLPNTNLVPNPLAKRFKTDSNAANENISSPASQAAKKGKSSTVSTNEEEKVKGDIKENEKIAFTEWDQPLADGEIEYFIPARKIQVTEANVKLSKEVSTSIATPSSSTNKKKTQKKLGTPKTPGSTKRVKIDVKRNTIQKPCEYIKQIKSSPHLPYDADKKPGKGLLKPNSIPSPINPFYKKKIGLRLAYETP